MRVAVLGQGSIGRRHAGILRKLGCSVTVFDPAPGSAPQQGVDVASSEEAALERADAALVASPTSEHLRQAQLALEAGCHLLVEKPLAVRAGTEVDALADSARERGLVLAVAMNLRFHSGPAVVAGHVRAGRIGRPLTASFHFGSYLPDWRPQVDYRDSYSARSELGGGVLLDVIHELDLGTWMLGPATEVAAWMERVSDLEIDVEDTVLGHVRHASGALASYELDYLDRSYRRGCRVVGSEASAEWDWRSGQTVLVRGDEVLDSHPAPRDFADTYRAEVAAWVDAVDAGAIPEDSPLATGAEGAGLLRLIDGFRESARDGRRVTLS